MGDSEKTKYLLLLLVAISLNSCMIILGIDKPRAQPTREAAVEIIEKKAQKLDVAFTLLFRTQNYISLTGDSALFAGQIWFFDEKGMPREVPDYCTPHTMHQFGIAHLDALPLDSSAIPLTAVLQTLETENGKRLTLSDFPNNRSFILMDWNTFINGPQRKMLRSVYQIPGAKEATIIFVNKDVIIADSLEQSYRSVFKF